MAIGGLDHHGHPISSDPRLMWARKKERAGVGEVSQRPHAWTHALLAPQFSLLCEAGGRGSGVTACEWDRLCPPGLWPGPGRPQAVSPVWDCGNVEDKVFGWQ